MIRKTGESGLRGHLGRLVLRRAVLESQNKQDNAYGNRLTSKGNCLNNSLTSHFF